jgi:hypothetical protein
MTLEIAGSLAQSNRQWLPAGDGAGKDMRYAVGPDEGVSMRRAVSERTVRDAE